MHVGRSDEIKYGSRGNGIESSFQPASIDMQNKSTSKQGDSNGVETINNNSAGDISNAILQENTAFNQRSDNDQQHQTGQIELTNRPSNIRATDNDLDRKTVIADTIVGNVLLNITCDLICCKFGRLIQEIHSV